MATTATPGDVLEVPEPAARRGRRHPIAAFVARRLLAGIATIVVASMLIFAAVQLLPGDVAEVVLGRNADSNPAQLAQLRSQLGLDDSLPSRYLDWVGGAVTGDLGDSATAIAQGAKSAPVWDAIRTPLGNSLVLALLTLIILVPLSVLLGSFAAARASRPTDHVISTVALTAGAMPEFLIGTVLVVVFFSQFDLLPPISQIQPGDTPFTHLNILVLPVLTLLGVSAAFTTRLVRAATIDVLKQDYVAMARLNGYRERRVIMRYALRNAFASSIQAIAQTAQYLVGGIIIVEAVFAYPGVGNQLVSAVNARDTTTIQGIALILAAIYVAINIVADVLTTILVPKLRTQV